MSVDDALKHVAQLHKERPEYAEAAVRAYLQAKGEEHTMPIGEHDISDLIADVYHLIDKLGFDREEVEARGLWHYTEELEDYNAQENS